MEDFDQLCPACGRAMKLARIIPRDGHKQALQVLQCGPCRLTLTKAAEDLDCDPVHHRAGALP